MERQTPVCRHLRVKNWNLDNEAVLDKLEVVSSRCFPSLADHSRVYLHGECEVVSTGHGALSFCAVHEVEGREHREGASCRAVRGHETHAGAVARASPIPPESVAGHPAGGQPVAGSLASEVHGDSLPGHDVRTLGENHAGEVEVVVRMRQMVAGGEHGEEPSAGEEEEEALVLKDHFFPGAGNRPCAAQDGWSSPRQALAPIICSRH